MARKSDFTLPPIPVDAIFSTQAERDDALLERVHNIPLEELHPFKDHPFKIQSGEEMDNGTRLKLVYGQSSKGSTYLKQIEKL